MAYRNCDAVSFNRIMREVPGGKNFLLLSHFTCLNEGFWQKKAESLQKCI